MRTVTSKISSVIFTIAIYGCSVSQPPAPAPVVAPVISFDGTYTGTIRLTSSENPPEAKRCDTPPQISFSIENNAFNFNLTRPSVPNRPALTFVANVGPDGSISGSAPNGEAAMFGLIAGGQISGQINGTACNYAFTAQRR